MGPRYVVGTRTPSREMRVVVATANWLAKKVQLIPEGSAVRKVVVKGCAWFSVLLAVALLEQEERDALWNALKQGGEP